MIGGFLAGASVQEITKEISLNQIKLFTSITIFFYGLVAGVFEFLGKESMKRFSGLRFLVHAQEWLPLKLRKMFFSLYIREILFYLSLTIIPLVTGLLFSMPISGIKIFSIGKFLCMLTLAFLVGISFSYFVTSCYRTNLKFFLLVIILCILLAPFLIYFFDIQNILLLTRSSDLASILVLILFNSILGTLLINEGGELEKFKPNFRVKRSKLLSLDYSPFFIKEFIDLKRSNTSPKILFSFLFPLVFLSAIFWFVEKNIEIRFSSISYAIFIGFFGLVIYSWLNNIDWLDFYDSLPISVSEIIKAKVKAHFCIALLFIPVFIGGISAVVGEFHLLPVALLVGFSNFVYISLAVAWLTGLRVNMYLFDPKILIKFFIFALLPQIPLSVLSFAPSKISIIFIVFVCLLLSLASSLFWKGIDEKWGKENFGF
jgi:hypothetical protein